MATASAKDFAFDFSGRKALVVGGSSGIGNGIAQALRRCGAEVHVWGTRARGKDYANEPGSDLEGLNYTQVDVADAAAIQAAGPHLDQLDVLVLSQGMVLYSRQEFEPAGFRKVVEVNLNSVMTCCSRYFEPLKAAAGSVIIISSSAAYHATKGNPAYSASKTALLGLTRSLGDAWAPHGVRVNGVAPGMVETKMTKVTTEHPKRRQAFLDRIPVGRFGLPGDIAGPVLFLASPLAAYVVGQTLPVDGGLILN